MINWLITRNIPACSCGFPAADKLYRSLERRGGFTTTALCEDTHDGTHWCVQWTVRISLWNVSKPPAAGGSSQWELRSTNRLTTREKEVDEPLTWKLNTCTDAAYLLSSLDWETRLLLGFLLHLETDSWRERRTTCSYGSDLDSWWNSPQFLNDQHFTLCSTGSRNTWAASAADSFIYFLRGDKWLFTSNSLNFKSIPQMFLLEKLYELSSERADFCSSASGLYYII